jgi:alkylation response protein AidB-like acyl-CoA dehydrogenase
MGGGAVTLDHLDLDHGGIVPGGREPDDLDLRFGDPFVPGPFDYSTIVADDEARRVNATASAILDEWDAAADLVPAALGGRWVSTEDLVRRWRPVFARDPSLAMTHGLSTFTAALLVWTAGNEAQRAEVARRLLRGERMAAGRLDVDGGRFADDCEADLSGDRWLVRGALPLVDGVEGAASLLIPARTRPGPRSGSHSLLIWHADAATRPLVGTARPVLTGGLRARSLATAEFDGLPVPVDGTIGVHGTAAKTFDTAAQVSGAVIPALAVATVDASVGLALRYGASRSLYGGSVLDLPQSRALLAGAVADLLVADAFSAVVVRALHLVPTGCGVLTAGSRIVVMELLSAAMQDLSVLFGSTFYARVAPYDVFEKFLRDLAALSVPTGTGTAAFAPVLRDLAAWLDDGRVAAAADPALFQLGEALDPLEFDRLASRRPTGDPLGGALRDPAVRAAFASNSPELGVLGRISEAFDGLRREVGATGGGEVGVDAAPIALRVAHDVTLALAAAAFAGVCAGSDAGTIGADPMIREAGLCRIEDRLAGRVRPLEPHLVERLLAFAHERTDLGIRLTQPARDSAPPARATEGDTT